MQIGLPWVYPWQKKGLGGPGINPSAGGVEDIGYTSRTGVARFVPAHNPLSFIRMPLGVGHDPFVKVWVLAAVFKKPVNDRTTSGPTSVNWMVMLAYFEMTRRT